MLAAARRAAPLRALRVRRQGYRRGGVSRRVRRPDRAHDEHHQRFRTRDGFARRRDQFRPRARRAGVRLGRAVRRSRNSGEAARAPFNARATSVAFLFLLCCAARLARFNIQKNPVPKNPGRPDRKYFVGLPTPAAAAMVAAVVYAADAEPLTLVAVLRGMAGAAAAGSASSW